MENKRYVQKIIYLRLFFIKNMFCSIKKSTIQQLQLLVKHMEDNPEFARGIPVFGSSKFSAEEEWKTISQKLNSVGPPTRSIAEWKKVIKFVAYKHNVVLIKLIYRPGRI